MAKTKIFGEAIVITSTLKLDDLKAVSKYYKEKLNLYGGEDGKDLLFGIRVASSGMGALAAQGAFFAPTSRVEGGFATITMTVPAGVEDAKKWMVEEHGGALMHLAELEKKLPDVVAKIVADEKAVAESIEA